MPFPITDEQKQTALWLSLWAALAALLYMLGPILTPFIIAAILAYALNPSVDRLATIRFGRVHLPRLVGVIIVMLGFFSAVLALVLIVAPVLKKELPLLSAQFPAMLAKLKDSLGPLLQDLGLQVKLDSDGLKDMVTKQFSTSGEDIGAAVLSSLKIGGTAVLGWVLTVVLVPVALFYLLLDWHKIVERLTDAVPRRWVAQTVGMMDEVDSLLAQYLRGQLMVMLILSIYYSAWLGIMRFDVALPVGILTGMLVFIPYVGFGIGLVLALVAALLQFPGPQGLFAVAVIYGSGYVLEGFYLTPRLVGERIGLNPLAVIFALLAFGQLFGFVGVLLALPASAILMVAFKHLKMHYLASSFYQNPP